MHEREGLITRIRQIRRAAAVPPTTSPADARTVPDDLQALGRKIDHLEALIEALQDSVHRESGRQDERIAELESQIQPAALGQALSKDARDRGL